MSRRKSYDPYIPTPWEIDRAQSQGMTPDEYLRAGREAAAYERQIAAARAAKYGGGYAADFMDWDDSDEV